MLAAIMLAAMLVGGSPAEATPVGPSACMEDAVEVGQAGACKALDDIARPRLRTAAYAMVEYCGARNAAVWAGKGGPYGRCLNMQIMRAHHAALDIRESDVLTDIFGES